MMGRRDIDLDMLCLKFLCLNMWGGLIGNWIYDLEFRREI